MSSRVLLLTIFNPELDFTSVETKLDKAKDWLRFEPGAWLIHTSLSANTWYGRIKDAVTHDGTLVFLCEVNLEERAGQLSPEAWKWIKKVRTQTALTQTVLSAF